MRIHIALISKLTVSYQDSISEKKVNRTIPTGQKKPHVHGQYAIFFLRGKRRQRCKDIAMEKVSLLSR
jgi:hypothetical protein